MIGLGCSCALCKQPHVIPRQPVEPGTPEHAAWLVDQAEKRAAYERDFRANRPPIYHCSEGGVRG